MWRTQRIGLGWLGLALGWILAFEAPEAGATRLAALTPEQLVERAERVGHGRVSALETRRDPDGRIFTRVTIQEAEIWFGPGAGSRDVVAWVASGGVLGDERAETVGQARFAVGDEVVVFLVRNPAGDWSLVGLEQGRFLVRRDAGQAWVHNRFWGDDSPPDARPPAGIRRPGLVPWRLEDFKRRIVRAARGGRE